MKNKGIKFDFFNKTTLSIVGVLLIFLSAVILLWQGNKNSTQADPAMLASVYFEGDYRIGEEEEWKEIKEGEHISSTKGDVTLRGKFHMVAPNGEYVGVYTDEIPIAFYTNHINSGHPMYRLAM